MGNLICSQNGFGASVGKGDGQDTVAVVIINDEDVIVTGEGLNWEFAGEIHVGLPGGFQHFFPFQRVLNLPVSKTIFQYFGYGQPP